jgi:hypothetical protein
VNTGEADWLTELTGILRAARLQAAFTPSELADDLGVETVTVKELGE